MFRHTPRLFITALCLVSLPIPAATQVITVTGRVTDGVSGAPVEFANVFLAQTTSGTSTDSTGAFSLRNVPPGVYELIVSRVGYTRASQRVDLTAGPGRPVRIALTPRELQSDEVEVIGLEPDEWRKRLEMFTAAFVGRTENASSCTVLNPQHLDFRYDPSTRLLNATCDTTLVIENSALGYRIDVEMHLFEWNVTEDIGRYVVYPRFTPLPATSPDDSATWASRRERTYRGSFKHFLASMVSGRADEAMFAMHTGTLNQLVSGNGEEASTADVSMTPDTLLGGYRLAFSGWLRVDYCGRIPREATYLLLRVPYARVDRHGNLLTPLSVQVAGTWARCRMADMLPLY